MDAGLALEVAVGVVALDVDRRLWMPAAPPSSRSVICGREALRLGPHQVHPQEHLGPVARLGAAGAGVDGHEGVAVVVRARRASSAARTPRSRPRPASTASRISSSNSSSPASSASSIDACRSSACATELLERLEHGVERLQLLDDRLGLLLVVPERRAFHLAVERVAAGLLVAQVKESLVDGRSGRSRSWLTASVRRPRRSSPPRSRRSGQSDTLVRTIGSTRLASMLTIRPDRRFGDQTNRRLDSGLADILQP